MSVVVTTAPEAVVSLAEAKTHLRVSDDDNAYITSLIAVAQQSIDGPAGWLGRAIGMQTLEYTHPAFYAAPGGAIIKLPFIPAVDVESIKFTDAAGAEQTVAKETYSLIGNQVAPKGGAPWPSANELRIRYKAGYALEKVPAPLKHAILLMVGELYASRESASEKPRISVPMAAENLLAPYRVWHL